MLVIRFIRTGKKNQPFFRIIVTDKKNPPRGGRFLEILGSFNPLTKEKVLKEERIKYWLSKGAQLSARAHNLLVGSGMIKAEKISVHKKTRKKEASVEEKKSATEEMKTGEAVSGEAEREGGEEPEKSSAETKEEEKEEEGKKKEEGEKEESRQENKE